MTLVFIVGPPAVGKMTVGCALSERTGLRLFHNHLSIDLALRYFDFGTPEFGRISSAIRRQIFEEVAGSTLPGLIFTYVWDFDSAADAAYVEGLARIFRTRQRDVYFVELDAPQAVRLERNETAFRLSEKPVKRDLASSRRHLLDVDARHRLNSDGENTGRGDWLCVANADLSPQQVAERILSTFPIPRIAIAPGS